MLPILFTLILLLPFHVHAHEALGLREFPATMAIEDPGVGDELIFPKVRAFKETDDGVTAWNTEIEGEFSKLLTDRLAIIGAGTYLSQSDAAGGQDGFENFELTGKYQFYENPARELVMSLGLGWEIGDSGSDDIGAEEHSVITPQFYFGKGFGDLPDSMHYLKPFAITGQFGYGIATDDRDDTGARISDTASYGLTLQYSLPYLEKMGTNVGAPFNRIVPLIEFAAEQPVNHADDYDLTGTVNPGFIWMGDGMQIGLEAVLPLTKDSGQGVGVMAQLHWEIEDLFE